jgi:parafibromin
LLLLATSGVCSAPSLTQLAPTLHHVRGTTTTNRPSNVAVNKKREGSGIIPYKVVDNVAGMAREDWDRVVACFVTGPEWELKRWPLYKKGGPPGVFSQVKGFYMYFDGQKIHENVPNWDVTVLKINKEKRHLDNNLVRRFWEVVDAHTFKNRADLRI